MHLNEEPPESSENMLVSCFSASALTQRPIQRAAEVIYRHYFLAALSSPPAHTQHSFTLSNCVQHKCQSTTVSVGERPVFILSHDRVVFFWTREKNKRPLQRWHLWPLSTLRGSIQVQQFFFFFFFFSVFIGGWQTNFKGAYRHIQHSQP